MFSTFEKLLSPVVFTPVLRHLLQFGAGYLASKGIIDGTLVDTVVGVGLGVFTIAWFFIEKPSEKAVKASDAVDDGKTVVVAAQPAEVIKGEKK